MPNEQANGSATDLCTPLARIREQGKSSPPRISEREQFEEDHALRRRSAGTRLEAEIGKRYGFHEATLDKFKIYDQAQQVIVARLRTLLPELKDFVEQGSGLVFLGAVGTGKDHLMAAMLWRCAWLGISCGWINGQELFGAFRDRIDTGKRDEDQFRDLCLPAVLAISDPIPPVGQPGAWDLGNLYRLLDRRYRQKKSTWLAINAESVADADGQLSAPVFDRLRDGAEVFECFWPSFRKARKPAAPVEKPVTKIKEHA